jgi:hypothetical protein
MRSSEKPVILNILTAGADAFPLPPSGYVIAADYA